MTNVRRVHGIKYHLSRFTLAELEVAAANTRRGLREHHDFLHAIEQERRAREELSPSKPAGGRLSAGEHPAA